MNRKTNMLAVLLPLLMVASAAFAQTPWDATAKLEPIGQIQVTFLTATSAELAEQDGKTIILAEELDAQRGYGVILVADKATEWIELHDSAQPFPPQTLSQYAPEKHPGRFLARGRPGQKFFASLRGNGPPTWAEVVIASVDQPDYPPSDPPTPPNLKSIMELSKKQASSLNDQATAARLKAAINQECDRSEALCKAGQCEGLPVTKSSVVKAIETALSARTGDSLRKDWLATWRRPISDAINKLNPQDPPAYIAIMRAVTLGL